MTHIFTMTFVNEIITALSLAKLCFLRHELTIVTVTLYDCGSSVCPDSIKTSHNQKLPSAHHQIQLPQRRQLTTRFSPAASSAAMRA